MVPKNALKTGCDGKCPLTVPVNVSGAHFALALILAVFLNGRGAVAETLEVIRKIPHTGYSEGLDYHEGFLWHALPKEILKIDPKDGGIVARFAPGSEYSESILWLSKKMLNLSYSDNGIYVGKIEQGKFVYERKGTTPEPHSWGITFDGKHVVITGNFSNKLYFLGDDLKVKKTITTSISDLEDLAWDGKGIWTSSFSSNKGKIFRVNPTNGDIGTLFSIPNVEECPVIDGIAYDGKDLWVTGKHCTSIYLVKKPTEAAISAKKK